MFTRGLRRTLSAHGLLSAMFAAAAGGWQDRAMFNAAMSFLPRSSRAGTSRRASSSFKQNARVEGRRTAKRANRRRQRA